MLFRSFRQWGNAGRAIATGPGLAQVDLSLQKTTHLTERLAVAFRIEMFNLFNRKQANIPAVSVGSIVMCPGPTNPVPECTVQGQRVNVPNANFGLVTSGLNRTIGTGTSRQLQLALRLNF